MSSVPGLDAAGTIEGPVAHETHWAAYDAAGIQRLLAVEDRHFWFRARNLIIAALVGDPIHRLPDGFRILEVGCGSGNVLRVLKRAAAGRGGVEGLEVSGPASEVARERTRLSVTNGHLADLRTPEPYDIIAAFDVLEHISDEAGALSQMRRGSGLVGVSFSPSRASEAVAPCSMPSSRSSPWSTRWHTRDCDASPSSFDAGGNCPSARPLP